MKKTVLMSLIASFALARSITLMPYGGYLNYSGGTDKDYGYVGGAYLGYYERAPQLNSGFKYELDLEDDYIHYKTQKDYRSLVSTFIANWYYGYNWAFKGGINYEKINNSGAHQHSSTYIGGVQYYKSYKFDIGIDYYKTVYIQQPKGLNINQVTPYIGINFGRYYSKTGSFYLKLKYDYIWSGNYFAHTLTKKDYNVVDIKLTNYKGKFTTTLKASFGKAVYKVADGGFVFYSTGDEYKNSYGIDIAYALNKTSSLKVGYTKSYFTETGNANSNTFVLSYTKNFYF